jgi:hypothetical protein
LRVKEAIRVCDWVEAGRKLPTVNSFWSTRMSISAGVLLVGVAVVVGMSGVVEPGRPGGAAVVGDHEGRSSAKSGRRIRAHGSRSSAVAREIQELSLDGVLAQLPAKPKLYPQVALPEWERTRLLFRRLGELEGEQALDDLVERYGKGQFTAIAMTEAVIGWMSVDRDEALAAFDRMMRGKPGSQLGRGITWNACEILSGFG